MKTNFDGARVLSLESRRSSEMARLIENFGGTPTVVPSLREVPLEIPSSVQDFADVLQNNTFDITIWTTGVGTKMLGSKLDECAPHESWVQALKSTLVVSRGPKPIPILREWGVPVAVSVPSPNTWREVLVALDEYVATRALSLKDKRIAIQDFPTMDARFISELEIRGALLTRVPVYRYELPEDTLPMKRAIWKLVGGGFDCALFTAGVQMWHLLKVAAGMKLENDCVAALQKICIGAVGPTCAEVLRECGIAPDIVPEYPKMGHLVKECAVQSYQFSHGNSDEPEA